MKLSFTQIEFHQFYKTYRLDKTCLDQFCPCLSCRQKNRNSFAVRMNFNKMDLDKNQKPACLLPALPNLCSKELCWLFCSLRPNISEPIDFFYATFQMKQFPLFKKIFSEHPKDNNHNIAPYDTGTTLQDMFTTCDISLS